MSVLFQFDDGVAPDEEGRMARGVRRLLRPVLRRHGFLQLDEALDRLPPVDFRDLDLHPADVLARAKGLRPVLDVSLARCIGHRAAAFPCVPDRGHPFVETARAILSNAALGYSGSPLDRYHRAFRPRTAAEHLGLAPDHPGCAGPPEAVAFPWEPSPTPDAAERRRRRLREENREHGRDLGPEHGFHHFGPVSEAKGALEIARLRGLLQSIRAEGFRMPPGPSGLCTARILVSGEDWRALIVNGQHRIATLVALGRSAAPLRPLPGVVRRDEAADWPAVRAGLLSLGEALSVFDRVFAGRQPAALDPAYHASFAREEVARPERRSAAF